MQYKQNALPKNKLESSERIVGIEILRIVSMLMVISIHYWGGGRAVPEFTDDWLPLGLVESFCAGAVNIYALISGYVMYGKKHSILRIISLWLEVLIISVFGLVAQMIFAFDTVSAKSVVQSFFPFLSGRHWYFSAYIMLYLLIPFLNTVIENSSAQQANRLILILLSVFSVASTASIIIGDPGIFGLNAGFSVTWLAVLFLIGAYINKFRNCLIVSKLLNNRLLCMILAMICGLAIFAILLIVTLLKGKIPYISILLAPAYYRYFTPLVVTQSILIFFSCVNLKATCETVNRVILCLGPLTFGIYIIHVLPAFQVIVLPYLKQIQACNDRLSFIISAVNIIWIFLGCALLSFVFRGVFGGITRKSARWLQKKINNLYGAQSSYETKDANNR